MAMNKNDLPVEIPSNIEIANEPIKAQEEWNELLETLDDVIHQACYVPTDMIKQGYYDSRALTAYADGIRVLAKHGILEIEKESGRRIIAHRKQPDPLEVNVNIPQSGIPVPDPCTPGEKPYDPGEGHLPKQDRNK